MQKHSGKYAILTCSHNVSRKTPNKPLVVFTHIYAYQGRVGGKLWAKKINVTSVYHYGQYKGNHMKGYDLAILVGEDLGTSLSSEEGLAVDSDTYVVEELHKLSEVPQWPWFNQDPPALETGPAKIVGYPGEPDKRGYAFEANGEITERERTDQGGHIYYHDVDTTAGQSGSTVWSDGVPVAVHTGFDDFYEANCATVITKEIADWIKWVIHENAFYAFGFKQ